MSWMYDLYQMYENNKEEVGKNLASGKVLLPIAHSTQNAQIEMVISLNGTFIRAQEVAKEDAVTIIPVTEDSGTRGNGIAPHPLEDKLEYLAGDYETFTGKDTSEKYRCYLEGLARWAASQHTCQEVIAIYEYVQKGQVVCDLIVSGVLEQDEVTQKLTDKKINGISQKDAFIRFSIQPETLESLGQTLEVYKNTMLFDCYVAYYTSQQEGKDLCYVTGKYMPCATKQPAKIRHAGDKAKLVSANDESGFTYKGRLEKATQVASVGYDVSQKAHNALRWLMSKQGFSIDELSIVAWEQHNHKILSPTRSSWDALFEEEESVEVFTTNEAYARQLAAAAKGYRRELGEQAQVTIMGVEAATTGRLSISFYKQLSGSLFMEHMMHWYGSCFWYYRQRKYSVATQSAYAIGTPTPKEIASVAFGDKNNKVLKATIERLLPCIIDKRRIPRDIVKAAVARVSKPNSFESKAIYQNHVAITCALIRKSRYDYQKEEWEMALDCENRDRSYVYGRLLAAAQKLEEVALYQNNENSRETAVERFMQQMVKKPSKTWLVIDAHLAPYKTRLKAVGKTWYAKQLQEIYDLIDAEDFTKNEPLTELYLLGYNCQMNSYNKSKQENEGDDVK